MKWTRRKRSADIEDRRGQRATGRMGGGAKLTLGGGGVVMIILGLIFGPGVFQAPGAGPSPGAASGPSAPAVDYKPTAEEEKLVDFISFVLDDLQETWIRELPKQTGKPYQKAKLVLFTDSVDSACGLQKSAVGPFYCPGDHKLYIDLSFYKLLSKRFGAPGDFAQAYVVGHEIGHHLQKLLGIFDVIRRNPPAHLRHESQNELSIRQELQADCLAGVWGYFTKQRKLLSPGDIKEGLDAAAAIGDDALQKGATGHVQPESWTHGSSEQRMRWFKRGFESGKVASCDTLAAKTL